MLFFLCNFAPKIITLKKENKNDVKNRIELQDD